MRKCFTISLILAAAMLVGCQTQSWRDTDFAPGAGRGADTPWQVQGGQIELNLGVGYGFAALDNEEYLIEQDFETYRGNFNVGLGYMINDYWQIGGFFQYAWETWEPDEVGDDLELDGWTVGPELTYNFSNVGTEVVPFCSLAAGFGQLTAEVDGSDDEDDVDRMFGQAAVGLRFFPWEGIAWNIEGYFRYVEDEFDESDVTIRTPWEFGAMFSISVFF